VVGKFISAPKLTLQGMGAIYFVWSAE
jgi:hypothetical protein